MADLIHSIKTAALEAVEAGKPCDVMFGTVMSTAPLTVSVDQKLVLGEKQLVLTRYVTDYEIDMTVDHVTEEELGELEISHDHGYSGITDETEVAEEEHSHDYGGTTETSKIELELSHNHEYKGRKTFLVHNALTVGEKVLLIRAKGGQKFIIVDRLRL